MISEYTIISKVYGCQLVKGYATAYTAKEGALTCTGEQVYEGGCSGCKDYIGKYIAIFKRLPDDSAGDIIGIYYCNDTGGSKGIKDGKVIDVYQPSLDKCQEFMNLVYEDGCNGHVWIVIGEKEEFFKNF